MNGCTLDFSAAVDILLEENINHSVRVTLEVISAIGSAS